MIERVENEEDRREFRLRLTRKGRALYEELIPRLLRKEQEILSCLSAQERKDLGRAARQDRAEPRSGADQRRGGREGGVLRFLRRHSGRRDDASFLMRIQTGCPQSRIAQLTRSEALG